MPRDDAATAAAKQDIVAEFDRELGGSVGHRPVRLGWDVVARGAQQSDSPADLTAPDAAAASPEGLPFGHGPIRLGGPVVAGPPEDALEMARLEILAELFGAPTPGAM